MKRAKDPGRAAGTKRDTASGRVSIRAIYSEALREVMADPRKAIAEHDPWLAALLAPGVPAGKNSRAPLPSRAASDVASDRSARSGMAIS